MASTEGATVEVPKAVRVRCPLVEFRLRVVANHCPTCPHFRGLADRFPGSNKPFHLRYLVQCSGEPLKRELFQFEGDDA